MKTADLIPVAERKLKKAKLAYEQGIKRQGVTRMEEHNLYLNLKYAETALELIKDKADEEDFESFERAYGTWRDDYELEG